MTRALYNLANPCAIFFRMKSQQILQSRHKEKNAHSMTYHVAKQNQDTDIIDSKPNVNNPTASGLV